MAALISWIKNLPDTTAGRAISVVAYAIMLILVLVFFTGHGSFIYEGF